MEGYNIKIGSNIGEVSRFCPALTSCFVALYSKYDSGCSNNPAKIYSGPEFLCPGVVSTNSVSDLARTRHCWRGLGFEDWVTTVPQSSQDSFFVLSFPLFDNCSLSFRNSFLSLHPSDFFAADILDSCAKQAYSANLRLLHFY